MPVPVLGGEPSRPVRAGAVFLCPFRGRGAWENEDIRYLCRDEFISI